MSIPSLLSLQGTPLLPPCIYVLLILVGLYLYVCLGDIPWCRYNYMCTLVFGIHSDVIIDFCMYINCLVSTASSNLHYVKIFEISISLCQDIRKLNL